MTVLWALLLVMSISMFIMGHIISGSIFFGCAVIICSMMELLKEIKKMIGDKNEPT